VRHLELEPYETQRARWPEAGRHILAQFDADTIVVYQAYQPSIGLAAVADQRFGGGGFSLDRMSWIKPNFSWMMFRSGWGTKPGQDVVLAIWLRRAAFDAIVAQAVPSSYDAERYADRAAWSDAVKRSNVRAQWDPDHAPSGAPIERRAIQLGLRGPVLASYARESIVEICDISPQVREMRAQLASGGTAALVCPREAVYPATPSS
jgi:Domain of unknown function (DUF4291)